MAERHKRAENLRLLHDSLNYTLDEREKKQFTQILVNFQTTKHRESFVISLRKLLSTSKKQEIVPYLIAILPVREREYFLDLWMRTSEYHSFYEIDDRRSRRASNGRPASYNGSYPVKVRLQDLSGRKRQMQRPSHIQKKVKRNSPGFEPLSNLANNRLSSSLPSLRHASQPDKQEKTHRITLKRSSKSDGFGFSIRGGAEHGLGIFVSSVDGGSVADRKNLTVGDQIIKLNELDFQNVESSAAIKIIQQSKKLRMLVFSAPMFPGSRVAHVDYQWVDTNGRPSSPPANFRSGNNLGRSRSIGDIRLLQDDDERRVIVNVQSGTRLGLRIRGGTEYGVGIYVSSVDPNQVAERSGIRAGDQIVEVNRVDFQEITHREAVRVLKAYRMMSLLLRHIGKIPYARTVFEKTEWIDSAKTSRSPSVASIAQDGRLSPSPEKSKFRQGIAGSQLLHQSTVAVPAHKRIMEEARSILNDNELSALKYYISQYLHGEVHVGGLVISLFHLFDSSTKITLLNDIRTVIFPSEVDTFDRLVLEKEIEAMKNLKRDSSLNGRSSNEIDGKTLSEPKSPKVPAKVLSYKQIASPKQQPNSKIPWSPPTGPLPKIPVAVDEQVLSLEEIQIQEEVPDLDFEDDEEESLDDDTSEIVRGLEEDFNMAMFDSKLSPQSSLFNGETENDNDYEEIDIQKHIDVEKNRIMLDKSSSPSEQRIVTVDGDNLSRAGYASQKRGSPDISSEHSTNRSYSATSYSSYQAEDSDSIGVSLMRSALGFAGTNNYPEDNGTGYGELDTQEKVDVEKKEEDSNDSKAVIDDIHALYAKPDKRDKGGNRSRIIPGEKLENILESDVSHVPSSSKHMGDAATKPSRSQEQTARVEVVAESADATMSAAPPSSGLGLSEEIEVEGANENALDDIFERDVNCLSSFMKSMRVDEEESGRSRDGSGTWDNQGDEPMTLEELQGIGEDLEFEFEDEPEMADTVLKETDEDVSSLKFAPIKEQETAPSSPCVNQTTSHIDTVRPDAEKIHLSQVDKARAANVYESDHSVPRSFGFSPLSVDNKRQRFAVQNVSNQSLNTFEGFHSFSPKIMNGLPKNESPDCMKERTMPDSQEDDNSYLGFSRDGSVDRTESRKTRSDLTTDSISYDSNVLVLPNRNLTDKRIPVISYRADDNIEKETLHGDDEDEQRSGYGLKSSGYSKPGEDNGDKYAFRNLRSIFEHQQATSPRTEYLSEIIKKNKADGRRRLHSSESLDENSNEIDAKEEFRLRRGTKNERNEQLNSSGVCASNRSKENGGRNGNARSFLSTAENDLSPIDDFDFSSNISKRTVTPSSSWQFSDDKVEISSGYGSEDYSPANENGPKTVNVEKKRGELGIALEPSKKQRRGVQIKTILQGESYAACQYPQLKVGQEVIAVDGESMQGLGAKIASISINRAYNNPSGRFLEMIVR